MTERQTDTGLVKSVERREDEDGRQVLRATVDFYDGDCPDITFGTVWNRRPVRIVHADGESVPVKEGS